MEKRVVITQVSGLIRHVQHMDISKASEAGSLTAMKCALTDAGKKVSDINLVNIENRIVLLWKGKK